MMKRNSHRSPKLVRNLVFLIAVFAAISAVTVVPAVAQLEGHANDLPTLTPDAHFPRCTYQELEGIGFPDHRHAWHWGDWEPPVDDEGQAYGPGAFCTGDELAEIPGLVSEPGVQRLGHFAIHHNAGYKACDMLFFLALLDMAGREVPPLLGLSMSDTLHVHSPDTIDAYREATGYDVWRLYKLDGNRCISEPLPILQARTLDGHAMYAIVTEWLLRTALPTELPAWLRGGLTAYVAEDGVHLVNYMGQFRPLGPILFSAPLINSILGGSPNPNKETDREMYRRASYSAFLMVWELVENQGGLEALRDFLGYVAEGTSLDEASRLVYGMPLQALEGMLDPAAMGEPIGKAVQSRSPHLPPQ